MSCTYFILVEVGLCLAILSSKAFHLEDHSLKREAFVTLATNDVYSMAALVMAGSMRRQNTGKELAIIITNEVSEEMKRVLKNGFNDVIVVDELDSKDDHQLRILNRPELGITFTKIQAWNLVHFSKCVFMDADTIIRRNVDELFERNELSAAPDFGWPDYFNSGVFVFTPSKEKYYELVRHAEGNRSFDGADQGFLNTVFSDWSRDSNKTLSVIYNCPAHACFMYVPAFRKMKDEIKVVHFLGDKKPWKNMDLFGETDPRVEYKQMWWDVLRNEVKEYFKDSDVTKLNGVEESVRNSLQ